jgi:hypothetical protein
MSLKKRIRKKHCRGTDWFSRIRGRITRITQIGVHGFYGLHELLFHGFKEELHGLHELGFTVSGKDYTDYTNWVSRIQGKITRITRITFSRIQGRIARITRIGVHGFYRLHELLFHGFKEELYGLHELGFTDFTDYTDYTNYFFTD